MSIRKDRALRVVERIGWSYLALNLSIFVMFILIRIFEYFFVGATNSLPSNAMQLEVRGMLYDLFMLLNISAILFIPYLLLHFIKPVISNVFYLVVGIILCIVYISLIMYFSSTFVLLGADLYGYSFKEITQIISTGGFSVLKFLPFVIIIGLPILLFDLFKRFKFKMYITTPFIILCLISLLFSSIVHPSPKKYKNETEISLVTSKLDYFFVKSYHFFFSSTDPTEEDMFAYFYQDITTSGFSGFKYVSKDYPFLHVDETRDVLGKYFNVGKKKPNFVFIICESLGRSYSGENAYFGNYTSFIDTLEKKSLYWENFLSSAGRSFEALPSIFGSLPYGERGFCEMGSKMPRHQSLLKLLHNKGYKIRFFYGSDAEFDFMKTFLQFNYVDQIIEGKDFGPSYKKMPANNGGFTWGYGDKELFTKSFDYIKPNDTLPRIDIFFTITMHDPYRINNQEGYIKKVENLMDKWGFNEEKKKEYKNYENQFSTVIAFDEAISYFFKTYAKYPQFKNTIFVITGDHRATTPPIRTQIERFHIPLIIYSPLLKQGDKFSSVSSHLDITPSIVAFLRDNYKMKFPATVEWIGQGLDIEHSFRSTHSMPFMRSKNELVDYLDNDYFYSQGQLYKLPEDMNVFLFDDNNKLNEVKKKFDDFLSRNKTACFENKLCPDSLLNYKAR